MTSKQFINALANGSEDILAIVASILNEQQAGYCVIGGLAVNAYADPVVSLDLDIVIARNAIPNFLQATQSAGFTVEEFENSTNLHFAKSDLRIQVQTDPRYQEFLNRASTKPILGYELKVADITDVLSGKCWAYLDKSRRASKRQKDLADIMRLVEVSPELRDTLPETILLALDR
ncbi:MAG: hypothetical protein IT367_14160 [Candidatus Hydrogenedentes bacterium]|nr:hypothetical protein [Candidatus Hydrogenedentota bacterium]